MRRAVAAFIILTALSGAVRADFRHVRMGPRPRAMGSAFTGVADDANAIYWNAAGMIMIDKFEITGCMSKLYDVADLSNNYVATAYNFNGRIAIGASWTRLELKDIYHEDTINLGIAAAVPRFEGLSIGAAFKIFTLGAPGYEKYNDPSYEGSVNEASVDLGLYYHSPSRVWTVGFSAYNLNEPGLQLLSTTNTPDPVYRDYALGGSYIFSGLLLVSYEVKTRYGDLDNIIGRLGSEIWIFDAVALRGGFERENLTAGFGLKGKRWEIDLALETHYDLGNSYLFGLTIRLP
jgi:hypothetical protein